MATPKEALVCFSHGLEPTDNQELKPDSPIVSIVRISPKLALPNPQRPMEIHTYEDSDIRTIITPDGITRTFATTWPPSEDPVMIKLNELMGQLDGNEVELDASMQSGRNNFDIAEWNEWKKRYPHARISYRQIYHGVLGAIHDAHLISQDLNSNVVDLFGGDGQLVAMMDKKFPGPQYHVIDRNEPSLERAKTRRGNIVVHEPIDLISETNIFKGAEDPVLVTAIGGICFEVVNREQALAIASRIFDGLKAGGVFLATGFSFIVLNSQDFRSIGFDVLQMSVPKNIFAGFAFPKQLYILQKPAR